MSLVKEIEENHDCSPLNNLYCNLKIRLINNLNEKDIKQLYNCSLCNNCHLASYNKNAREKAVSSNLICCHVAEIKENIKQYGNSYGFKVKKQEDAANKKETILFRGCTPTYKTPEILEAVEALLHQEKIEYHLIDNENCCGNILFNLGDLESGYEVVKQNIKKFKEFDVKKIITLCPGCYNAFNEYYKNRDEFNPEIVLAIDLLSELTPPDDRYVIQDPCHAKEKGIKVRKILKKSNNKSVSPCCGAGGGVMAHNKNLARTKAIKALRSGDKKIVTYCPFCYLNLSSIKPDQTIDIYMLLDKWH